MRAVNGLFCVVLGVFAIVQYNDPDALLWFLIYGVPAVWAGLAAWKPESLSASPAALGALAVCLVLSLAGMIYMWPAEFSTWWDAEEVREGMGLMIVTAALLVVAVTAWRAAAHAPRDVGVAG
jgi:hypothetical protein